MWSARAIPILAGGSLLFADAASAQLQCTTTPPPTVNVRVILQSARASEAVDGDNFVWNNYADLLPEVSINGGPFIRGVTHEGNDRPHFNIAPIAAVPRDIGAVSIRVRLFDDDGSSDPTDQIDIDPAAGDETLDLSFDLCRRTISGDDNADCPGGVCRAGVFQRFGPGNAEENASVVLMIDTVDGLPVPPPGFQGLGDVAIRRVDFQQIVENPTDAVQGRGSVLEVEVASTYQFDVTATTVGRIGDVVDETSESQEILIPACGTATAMFFVAAPVVVEQSVAHWSAEIDPDELLTPTFAPQCMVVNNGDDEPMATVPIQPNRALSVLYQPIYHLIDLGDDPFIVTFDEAVAEADAADARIRGFFPTADYESDVNPWALLHPTHPLQDPIAGPWTEIIAMSELADIWNIDRMIGLVPEGWLDERLWLIFPDGRDGVSNDKVSPRFVYAETGEDGFIPTHELGHTFGLSDETCVLSGAQLFQPWLCEDEYEEEVFPNGPFFGRGFDVTRGLRIPEDVGVGNPVPCFMGNQNDEGDAWVSSGDFESFVRRLGPNADPRVVVVTGVAHADGTGELLGAVGRPEGFPDRHSAGRTPFRLAIRNAAGATLGEYAILEDVEGEDRDGDGVSELGEGDGDVDGNGIPDGFPIPHSFAGKDRLEFALSLLWPAGGTSVVLLGPTGNTIDTISLSTTPPSFELIEPVGAVRLQPGDLLPVRWRFPGSSGPPSSVRRVALAASYADAGPLWPRAVASPASGAVVLDARLLAAPVTARIHALAIQDGITAEDASAGDADQDGCANPVDPQPTLANGGDGDADGVPDVCDRCTAVSDRLQTDVDQDGYGDACDADTDGDGAIGIADFVRGFRVCYGADVIARPSCYDADANGDGIVGLGDITARFVPQWILGAPGPSALAGGGALVPSERDHGGVALGGPIAAPRVEVVIVETGTDAIAVEGPDELVTAELRLHAGTQGVVAYGISLRFDAEELEVVSSQELLPAGFDLNFSSGVDGELVDTLLTFEAATPGDGPVDADLAIGRVVLRTLPGVASDGVDLVPGLFHDLVDGIFSNAGDDLGASLASHGAAVNLVPEPGSVSLALAAIAALGSWRRRA
jgi:hypothetical protein